MARTKQCFRKADLFEVSEDLNDLDDSSYESSVSQSIHSISDDSRTTCDSSYDSDYEPRIKLKLASAQRFRFNARQSIELKSKFPRLKLAPQSTKSPRLLPRNPIVIDLTLESDEEPEPIRLLYDSNDVIDLTD